MKHCYLIIDLNVEDFDALCKNLSKIQELLDNSLETNLKSYEVSINSPFIERNPWGDVK